MKQPKKPNSRGFSHHFLLPVIAILLVGGIGSYVMLRSSSAATQTRSCEKITFGRYRNNPAYSKYAKYKPCVKAIQKKVGAAQDGIYGNYTQSRVKIWQKNHSLTADGVVGPKTWAKMGISPNYKVQVASTPKNNTQFCRQSGEGGVWSNKAKKCVKVGSACKTLVLLKANDGTYNYAGVCVKK